MQPKSVSALESMVKSFEEQFSTGNVPRPEEIDQLVTEIEEALAWQARPPRNNVLKIAGRVVSLLDPAMVKKTGRAIDERTLRGWIGGLYQGMLKREEALAQFKLYYQLSKAAESLHERVDGLIRLAKACYWIDDQKGAVLYQRRALDLLDEARGRGELTVAEERRYNNHYTIWAFRYAQNTCRWSEAERAFKQAHENSQRWNDPGLLCDSLVLYAESKMFQGEWEDCERLGGECARAALYQPVSLQSDYPFWIWGRALVHTGNVGRAVPELERAIRLARKSGDAVGLSEALISRAEAYLSLGDSVSAIRTAEKAQAVAAQARLGINLAQVRVWRAWIEMEVDRSLAVRHLAPLHQSLSDFERCGTLSGWACALHALGHALVLSGRTEIAQPYLQLAVRSFREWNMPWHVIRAEYSLDLARR
jgi:tetratricopeptide (TPR) repeat protein